MLGKVRGNKIVTRLTSGLSIEQGPVSCENLSKMLINNSRKIHGLRGVEGDHHVTFISTLLYVKRVGSNSKITSPVYHLLTC